MNSLIALALAITLMAGMLVFLDIGRRIGLRRLAQDPEGARQGTGAVEGAVFALLGLLIAFTFSGAASRFDGRRDLIVQETNIIGTAYLRLDLLPADAQPALRDLFRRYLDARLEGYRLLGDQDIDGARRSLQRSGDIQQEIWVQAIAAGRTEGAVPAATMLVLPALNEMFDIATMRTLAMKFHPPLIIYVMLFALALVSALLAGYGMAGGRSRNWVHMVGLAAVMAFAVYVIIDLEFPRLGLIRVDAFDQALVDLRKTMD